MIPKHVAIIMDGNGRWAVARGKPRRHGHRAGAAAVREVVRGCRAAGVEYLTLYAFSLNNWTRPRIEVSALMALLIRFANKEVDELCEREISVGVVGRPDDLPSGTHQALRTLMERTACGTRMRLSLALSYSGRDDMTRAVRTAAELTAQGKLDPKDINEAWVGEHLSTHGLPNVDLLIRTGGEWRISDFLLFESAYAELYFTPVLWPDFTEEHLNEAFGSYGKRERRFGKTSQQVREGEQVEATAKSVGSGTAT